MPIRGRIPIIAAAIAINVIIAAFVQILKLPIYMDAIGTIIAAIMLGVTPAIIVGVVSFLIASVLVSPVYIYFIGTQAAIAVYAYVAARYWAGFSSWIRVIPTGIGLGILAGVVSAPVIVLVFGGATGSGRDLITAFIVSGGQQIVSAVFLSGAASEPIDKTLQCIAAMLVLRSLPDFLVGHFSNAALTKTLAPSPRK